MDVVNGDQTKRRKKRRKARNSVSHLWTPTNGGWSKAYSAVTNMDRLSEEDKQQKYKEKIKRMARRKSSKCIQNLSAQINDKCGENMQSEEEVKFDEKEDVC